MKWAYDLCGAEPIIRDEPVYDAAAIAYGELLMLGAGAASTGASSITGLISASASTAGSSDAVDAIGISLEAKTTASSPSIDTTCATTAEHCFVKTIINPFAVYRAEYVTSQETAITSAAATNMIVAGAEDNTSDNHWVYLSATAGPNFGDLRYCLLSGATDTVTMDSALGTTATTADKVIFIAPKNTNPPALDLTAVGIAAHSSGTCGLGNATNLRVVETWIDRDQGFEIMKPWIHKGLDCSGCKGGNGAKFYSDIVMKDHAFGVQE